MQDQKLWATSASSGIQEKTRRNKLQQFRHRHAMVKVAATAQEMRWKLKGAELSEAAESGSEEESEDEESEPEESEAGDGEEESEAANSETEE